MSGERKQVLRLARFYFVLLLFCYALAPFHRTVLSTLGVDLLTLSAAKIYGLDFLPVCVEQYDLIIPDYAWDTPMVRRALEILAGPAFRAQLEKLGGYTLDQPGRVRRVY